MMNILETRNLTKQFGSHLALDNVSLAMEEGAVYGLLGPNGAGKTTFLRLVNNILLKDSGEILFRGQEMTREIGKNLGYMPEERGLYAKMTMEDQILYFGMLRGKSKAELRKTMYEYMQIFSIPISDTRRKVQELSKGNQQKVQIIATLVHEPQLVMLDEPFSGFDPINGALLSSLIERLKERGTTIVLSSHNMSAVEEICSHMALINNGRLLVNGRIDEIKNQHKEHRYIISTASAVDFTALTEHNIVEELISTDQDRYGNYHYQLRINEQIQGNELLLGVCDQSRVLHFEEKLPSLADLFIKLTSAQS
jgi:ABC-2 type transport system ATP-binding protein